MIFSKTYTVEWHDTDANRNVTPSRLLRFMQETANAQLRENGIPLDLLRDRDGLAFLLSRFSFRVFLPLHAYETIEVQTWICEGTGMRFDRCFRVLRGGAAVAEAFSTWALLDLRSPEKKLLRNDQFAYPFRAEAPLAPPLPLRFRMPAQQDMEEVGTRRVVYSDIDYNRHMNNTRYPDMLCDFLPDVLSRTVTGMSLSYLREAAFGHTLRVFRTQVVNSAPETSETSGEKREETFLFRTVDADGATCLEAMVTTEKKEMERP